MKVVDLVDRNLHALKLSDNGLVGLSQQASQLIIALEKIIADADTKAKKMEACIQVTNLSHSINCSTSDYAYRELLVAHSPEEMLSRLKELVEQLAQKSHYVELKNQFKSGVAGKTAFLFSGQGAQYAGMAKGLFHSQPLFQANILACNAILQPTMGFSLMELMWGSKTDLLSNTQYTQPALFCVEYALTQLWKSWGIRPTYVLGHSVGSYAAAVCAGIFSFEDGLKLIEARGRLMAELTRPGKMLAILAGVNKVNKLIADFEDKITIAAVNAPESCVVSGESEAIDCIYQLSMDNDIVAKRLEVSRAFHSPLMEPMLERFREVAETITYHPPRIGFVSDVTGVVASNEVCTADYWVRHIISTVQFQKGMQTIFEKRANLMIEIGPSQTLLNLGKLTYSSQFGKYSEDWKGEPLHWMPSLRRSKPDWEQIFQSIKELYKSGMSIDWQGFDAPYPTAFVELDDTRYLEQHASNSLDGDQQYSVLGRSHSFPNGSRVGFEMLFNKNSPIALEDHQLLDCVIAPAALYLSIAEQTFLAINSEDGTSDEDLSVAVCIKDVLLSEALVPYKGCGSDFQTLYSAIDLKSDNAYKLEIFSGVSGSGSQGWKLHASMDVQKLISSDESKPSLTLEEFESFKTDATEMGREEYYALLAKVGYQYNNGFQSIDTIWRKSGESIAQLCVDLGAHENAFEISPELIDSIFQTAVVALPDEQMDLVESTDLYLPFGIDGFTIYKEPQGKLFCHAVLNVENTGSGSANGGPAKGGPAKFFSHDITVFDVKGELVFDIKAFQSRRVNKKTLKTMLSGSPNSALYRLAWKEDDFSNKDNPSLKEVSNTKVVKENWLVISGEEEFSENILSHLEANNHNVINVVHRDGENELAARNDGTKNDSAISVDLTSPDQLVQLVSVLHAEYGELKGVLYLAPLLFSSASSSSENALSMQAMQELSCGGLMHLTQALQTLSLTSAPRIWVFTQGSYSVDGVLPINGIGGLQQASLDGYVRTLANESPEYYTVHVDLDGVNTQDNIQLTLSELLQDGEDSLVAYRRGNRYVQRLQNDENQSALKKPKGAYQLVFKEKGVIDNLQFVSFQREEPVGSQVEVEVISSGLNFRDVMNVLGVYPGDAGPLGGECVGKVVRVGSDVQEFKIGQKVFVSLAPACFGSHVISESSYVCPLPEGMNTNHAATLPVTFGTAYHALIDLAKIKAGDKVLIHAAAGGVGLAAIQIAQQQGAEVYATASASKQAYLKSIGVKHIYNSRDLSFADQIAEELGGAGIDIVLNSLAAKFIKPSMALLKDKGRYVEIGKADVWDDERVKAHRPDMSYYDFDLVMEYLENPPKCRQIMDAILAGIEKGELRPLPQIVYPQSQAIDAFRLMSQGKHLGKIVLQNEDFNHAVVSANKSYVITGGNGGLGLKCAEYLLQRGAKEIILLGRSPLKGGAKNIIDGFKQYEVEDEVKDDSTAIKVKYHQVDMADMTAVNTIPALLGRPLGGVIHAAGLTQDNLITNQSLGSLRTVMNPKIAGAWNLHEITKDLPLDFFVMFSSIATVLGSPGQSNYAAANSFLDGLSHYRASLGLASTSINWGPWAEVGMAANQATMDNSASKGINYIQPTQGIDLLVNIFKQAPTQIGAFDVNWKVLGQQFTKVGMPIPLLLTHPSLNILGDDAGGPVEVDSSLQALADNLILELKEAYPVDRLSIVVDTVTNQLRTIMSIPDGTHIDQNELLHDLGLDSLVAVELRNVLCAITGKQLPATLLFKLPTIKALSAFIVDELFPEGSEDEDSSPRGLLGIDEDGVDEDGDDALDGEDLQSAEIVSISASTALASDAENSDAENSAEEDDMSVDDLLDLLESKLDE